MSEFNADIDFLDELIALAERGGWVNLPRAEPSVIILEWA